MRVAVVMLVDVRCTMPVAMGVTRVAVASAVVAVAVANMIMGATRFALATAARSTRSHSSNNSYYNC